MVSGNIAHRTHNRANADRSTAFLRSMPDLTSPPARMTPVVVVRPPRRVCCSSHDRRRASFFRRRSFFQFAYRLSDFPPHLFPLRPSRVREGRVRRVGQEGQDNDLTFADLSSIVHDGRLPFCGRLKRRSGTCGPWLL